MYLHVNIMKTPCHIENVNKCSNDSCGSMILRSACSHGHSHTSLVIDDVRIQNSEKKRTSLRKSTGEKRTEITNSKSLFRLESVLETTLKQISLKSTKTISILKENLYKRLENEQNGRSLTTSTPISSLLVQSSFFTSKDSFGDDHSSESMSERNLLRRPLNALSDSDTEDEGTEDQVRHKIITRSSSISRTNSSTGRFSSAGSSNHLNSNNVAASTSANSSGDFDWSGPNNGTVIHRNNSSLNSLQLNRLRIQDDTVIHRSNSSLNSPQMNRLLVQDDTVIHRSNSSLNSSQMNRLLVQESRFDRLRWIVWRYIYLKIIQWISLDVWLLAKLRANRKAGLLLFLLPLLVYLLSCAIISADSSSSLFSLLSSVSELRQCQKMETIKSNFLDMLPSLPAISSIFSAVSKQSVQSTFYTGSPSPEQGNKLSASQEQLESRVQDLEKGLRLDLVSHTQDVERVKDHLQEEMAELRQQVKLLQQFQKDQKLDRSSYSKDSERQSVEHEIKLVNKNLKLLEDQQVSFGNQQKLEKSLSSKDIEKLSAEQEKFIKKLKNLEEQLILQKLDLADFLASIEKHLVAAFRSVIGADKTSPYFFFNEWINSKSTETISSEIKIVIENLKREHGEQDASNKQVVEGLVRHYLHTLKSSETTFTTHPSDEGIQKIVRDAILLYDADKIGLVDYALESAGGSVVSIRCSESYTEKKGKFSLFGLPFWSDQNSPRTAIQPDVHPGRCWSFKGSQGFLVIQLSYAIRPTGFTLEHIPLSLSPTGSIDSAPKEFSVWGLASETDDKGTLLGHYSYDDKGHPLQYFIVQNSPIFPTSYVELKILSNHGNLEYTCLYRFRVHGIQVK